MIIRWHTRRSVRQSYRPLERVMRAQFNSDTPPHPEIDTLIQSAKAGYDPALAYPLSVVSGWSYSEGQTLANKLEYYGFPDNSVNEFAVSNPAMLVEAAAFFVRSRSGRVGVLSFRGTEPNSIIDLLTDSSVSQKSFGDEAEGSRVHTGFFDSTEVLWDDISDALELARRSDDPRPRLEALYLTGHSLGGAMAVIAAAKLWSNRTWASMLRGVYTYGQPSVGNRNFASLCQHNFGHLHFRHVYRADVIPHFPPRECGEFFHSGQLLTWNDAERRWLPRKGAGDVMRTQTRLIAAVPSVAVSALVQRLPGLLRFPDRALPFSIDDHMPPFYIAKTRLALLEHATQASGRRVSRTLEATVDA